MALEIIGRVTVRMKNTGGVSTERRSIHLVKDHARVGDPSELAGGVRSAGRLAAALLGIRVARGLHGRWQRLSAAERRRLEPLADDVRERALNLRGFTDPEAAGRDLQAANERLAGAMVESAEDNPEVTRAEVVRLREDLARELERLATADIDASRAPVKTAPGGAEHASSGLRR